MIFHETAIHQMTIEFKFLLVKLWSSIITRVHTITEAVKVPKIQNVKLFIKHYNRPNHLKL